MTSDSDLSLFFLSANNVQFTQKSDDPWYAARVETDRIYYGARIYRADETAASVLACSNQNQVCNGENCTPLSGRYNLPALASDIWSSQDQEELFMWFFDHVHVVDIGEAALSLGAGSLRARDGLKGGLQAPLPDNQWQLDVQHWLAVALSLEQLWAVHAATGPTDQHLWKWIDTNVTQFQRDRCNSQVGIQSLQINANITDVVHPTEDSQRCL